MRFTKEKIFRSKWSSEKIFILSTAAAAVGLGNIWRFPYIAGENGGASFILAYLISVIVLGIPLMVIEIGAGKLERGCPVKTFQSLPGRTKKFGWVIISLTLLIMSYYFVITGWSLGYALYSLAGKIPSFSSFTSTLEPLLYFGIVVAITAIVVAKGVKTIGKINKYLMPILLLTILFLTGYSLTLSGTSEALSFLFNPDFSSLLSPSIWLLACGQAFYSLAVGQGYLMTYGSFLPKKSNIPRSVGFVALIETGVALIAGLMIFPLVFTFGLNPSEGSELAFKTLPFAFKSVAFGSFFAVAFFWILFLAAQSSCIAGMEVVKTAVRERLKLTHYWATIVAFLPILPLGILSALSFSSVGFSIRGVPFLEVLDIFAANQIVIGTGLIGGAILGWKIPKKKMVNMFQNEQRRMVSFFIWIVKYLWVLILIILILSFFIS